MTVLDKIEAWRLRQVIQEIESAIANGAVCKDGAASMLARFMDETMQRISHLELSEKRFDEEKQQKTRLELAVAYLAAQETALSQREREQYGAFLSCDFFTKNDFATLEKFYANVWDRLSERGKDEMSNRVWEGVRRREYEFSELPDSVKEKEATRLRDLLSQRRLDANLENIPLRDRDDFVRAWDAGRKQGAYEVLNRSSFRDNVSVSTNPVTAQNRAVTSKSEALHVMGSEGEPARESEKAKPSSGPVELKLDEVMLVSNTAGRIETPLPGSSKGSGKEKG